jgi:hypothetical protein
MNKQVANAIFKIEGEYDYLFQTNTHYSKNLEYFNKLNKGWSLETIVKSSLNDNYLKLDKFSGDIFDGFKLVYKNIQSLDALKTLIGEIVILKARSPITTIYSYDLKYNLVKTTGIIEFRFTKSNILTYNPIFINKIPYQCIELLFKFNNYKELYIVESIYYYFDILKSSKLVESYFFNERFREFLDVKYNIINFKCNYFNYSLGLNNTCNYITSIIIKFLNNNTLESLFRINIYIDENYIWCIEQNEFINIDINTIKLEITNQYRYDLFLNNNVNFRLVFTNNIIEPLKLDITYEYLNQLIYKNDVLSIRRLGKPIKIMAINNNFFGVSNMEIMEIIKSRVQKPNICPITHEEFLAEEDIKICDKCSAIYKRVAIDKWLLTNNICPYARCKDVVWKIVKIPASFF